MMYLVPLLAVVVVVVVVCLLFVEYKCLLCCRYGGHSSIPVSGLWRNHFGKYRGDDVLCCSPSLQWPSYRIGLSCCMCTCSFYS